MVKLNKINKIQNFILTKQDTLLVQIMKMQAANETKWKWKRHLGEGVEFGMGLGNCNKTKNCYYYKFAVYIGG